MRKFVRVPTTGFVPKTAVRGSFERATSIGLALEAAGFNTLPLVREAAVRIPAK